MVVVDKLTYAGDLQRLDEARGRYTFYRTDICDRKKLGEIIRREKPHTIVHFAAETHVDRSILDAGPFIQANVLGTQNLIEIAKKFAVKKFVHVSTDEVYGENRKGRLPERAPLAPTNPYAATKACAELLLRAAMRTDPFPCLIVRPSNNYGPWQYPEKFIPVIILKALRNQKVPVYGQGRQIREWLHVADCAQGIYTVLDKGTPGETYNIGSYFENTNLAIAKKILKRLGKPQSLIQFVKDRPGHDFRYSVDCARLRQLGWRPQLSFEQGIDRTIDWYAKNLNWLENRLSMLTHLWRRVYKIPR